MLGMQNKRIFAWVMLWLSLGLQTVQAQVADSIKAETINKEAENPNFVHAYLLDITPGKAFYSVYGHNAIRMTCPSKHLDVCFTFEMNMQKSSYISVFTRKAKAGFALAPTPVFFKNYQEEGRGITQYELNLSPKQKQELWRILDQETGKGAEWDFNYTTVNCLSMVFYAINEAILPERIQFNHLPNIVKGDYTDWMDYVSRRSPWVRLIMRSVLHDVDGTTIAPEDKLSSEMVKKVLPSAVIISQDGHQRPLMKGKANNIQRATYHDAPCWFTPSMALVVILFTIILGIYYYHKKAKRKNQHKR